jgi:hypothetical protein
MGREVECEILAWRDGRSELRPYSQFRVISAPLDLLDGSYVVHSRLGLSQQARYGDDGWWNRSSDTQQAKR